MYKLRNFILLTFNLLCSINVCWCRQARILNANEAQLGLFASHVQLRLKLDNKHLCGGTLIEEQNVLTAASCVIGRKKKDFLVMAGDVSLYESTAHPIFTQVIQYYVHPLYDPKKDQFSYNIAVVKLVTPVPLSSEIAPVKLFTTALLDGRNHCFIPGWGITGPQGTSPHNLLFAELYVVDIIACGHCSPKTLCALSSKFEESNKAGPCHLAVGVSIDWDLAPVPLIVPEETESHCFLPGWGSIENGTRWISENLLFTEMYIASPVECGICSPKTVCAVAKDKGVGACTGDEGGGLYCNGYLRGIYAGSLLECTGSGATFVDLIQLGPWVNKMIDFVGGSAVPSVRSIRKNKRNASGKHRASNVILSIMLIMLLLRVN